jgi:hypothetical protein
MSSKRLEDRKSETVAVKVTLAEKRQWAEEAESRGYTLTDYLRFKMSLVDKPGALIRGLDAQRIMLQVDCHDSLVEADRAGEKATMVVSSGGLYERVEQRKGGYTFRYLGEVGFAGERPKGRELRAIAVLMRVFEECDRAWGFYKKVPEMALGVVDRRKIYNELVTSTGTLVRTDLHEAVYDLAHNEDLATYQKYAKLRVDAYN